MQITILDGHALNPGDLSWDELRDFGALTIYPYTVQEEVVSRSSSAQVIIINKVKMTHDILSQLPNLKMIVVSATGYDNVDIEACKNLDISVSNINGYSTESVAQHVLAMLLSHYNKIATYAQDVSNGRWAESEHFTFYDHSIPSIANAKIGVLGLGSIGSKVAEVMIAMGAEVYTTDHSSTTDNRIHKVSKDKFLSEVDVLTIHTPLTSDTKHTINATSLNLMKDDAILINTARGGHIHESELADHLKSNPSFTALLDVLSAEPPPSDHPLIGLSNCHITPHQAWASYSARTTLMGLMATAIKSYIDTGKGTIV